MKHYLRKLATVLSVMLLLGVQAGFSVPALAATPCPTDTSSKGQALQGIGVTGNTDCSGAGVTNIISTVVTILSVVIGVAAVIMIIIAGFKFVFSGGDASAVKSARETLIYALVGVAVAILAQFLVHFAINTSQHAAGNGYLPAQVQLKANA